MRTPRKLISSCEEITYLNKDSTGDNRSENHSRIIYSLFYSSKDNSLKLLKAAKSLDFCSPAWNSFNFPFHQKNKKVTYLLPWAFENGSLQSFIIMVDVVQPESYRIKTCPYLHRKYIFYKYTNNFLITLAACIINKVGILLKLLEIRSTSNSLGRNKQCKESYIPTEFLAKWTWVEAFSESFLAKSLVVTLPKHIVKIHSLPDIKKETIS